MPNGETNISRTVSSTDPDLAELAIDCRCVLGEGILWCPRQEVLWWTDIQSRHLWRHHPEGGQTARWTLPDRLGSLALCESGKLLLGFAKGLYLAGSDWSSAEAPKIELLVPVEPDEPRTRINDGRCDRCGNFVFGTLNEGMDRQPIGRFYQYSARGLRCLDLGGVVIPNSLCFSPDGRTMYYCDTTQPHILCCDYDADSATVANSRIFVTLPAESGCADGSTVDSEGCLWNAQWGGAQVARFTPEGELALTVRLPTRNPTCPAFGGRRLDRLYVTSARQELSGEELQRAEASGGVFCSIAAVVGLPESRVRHL